MILQKKESPNKNLFTNNLTVDTFVFTTAIISALSTRKILYLLCKHNKLRTLVASLVLQQVKEIGASAMKHDTKQCMQLYTPVLHNLNFK